MGAIWRASKSRLVNQVKKAKNEEERLKLKLDNIKSVVEWKAFVREKTSPAFQEMSQKYQNIRKKLLPHTTSCKGYARLIEDMNASSSSKSQLNRVAIWTKAHKKKSGEPVNSAVGEVIENLEQIQIERPTSDHSDLLDDALASYFGPERNGRMRAMGLGMTKIKHSILSEWDDNLQALQDKCNKTEADVKELKEIISLLLKSQVSGIRSEDKSNANVHSPVSVSTNLAKVTNNCKLLDWVGTREVVAEGCLMPSDPKDLVHHVPLGPNAARVWVHVAKQLDAFLWRPTSEMSTIEEAISSNVAWPADKILKGQ